MEGLSVLSFPNKKEMAKAINAMGRGSWLVLAIIFGLLGLVFTFEFFVTFNTTFFVFMMIFWFVSAFCGSSGQPKKV